MQEIRFFDAHVAVGPRRVSAWGVTGEAADVAARLRECGISDALVYHTASVEHHPAVGNEMVLEAVREVPGFHPVWAMLPFATAELGTADDLRSALRRNGVRAVLVYPAEHQYSGAEWSCGDLYGVLEEMRMPVFTRFAPSDFTWNDLDTLLAAHPHLPVILRNVNYQVDRNAYRMLERHGNLMLETARYLVFAGIEEIVRRFGPGRLVFGSETPLLSPGAAVLPLLAASISHDDKELIAGGTLRALVEGVRYGA